MTLGKMTGKAGRMVYRLFRCYAQVAVLLFAFSTFNVSILIAASSSDQNASFRWAFAALTNAQDQPKIVAMKSENVLFSGDKFKLMFEAHEQCYVYIIFKGSGGEILLLHPKGLDSIRLPAEVNKMVFIPSKRDWFTLDQHTGLETLYILASLTPLADLELLLKQYGSASPKSRNDIAQSIVSLLREKEISSQTLTAAAEKPILIGGTIRSITERSLTEEDISKFAQEIAIEDLFIRTYSIDHR